MRSLSLDLRMRILIAVEAGEHTLRELAEQFSVHLSTIVRLLHRFRVTGQAAPKPHAGGTPPIVDRDAERRLLELLEERPDATLAELREALGLSCSIMAIFRALRRLGVTRKRKTRHADERDSPRTKRERAAFCAKFAETPQNRLVFVDETATTTSMDRTYGRSPSSDRVEASTPGHWEKVTLIAGMRTSGVVAPFAFEGSADGAAFETYVEKVLAPSLEPGNIVIWDRLSVHGSATAKAAIEAAGATVEPLPPYSPDLNPIEEMFSKLKSGLQSLAARTTEAVISGIGTVLDTMTLTDIAGWFRDRCAYAMRT